MAKQTRDTVLKSIARVQRQAQKLTRQREALDHAAGDPQAAAMARRELQQAVGIRKPQAGRARFN